MAYNKAKEESKWKAWKQKEEEQMWLSGVPEDIILRIHELDWESFKAERGYLKVEIITIADLLNEIESRALFEALLSVDKLTLEIILLKIQGYSVRESAHKLGITEKSAYRRIDRLKELIKKVL